MSRELVICACIIMLNLLRRGGGGGKQAERVFNKIKMFCFQLTMSVFAVVVRQQQRCGSLSVIKIEKIKKH